MFGLTQLTLSDFPHYFFQIQQLKNILEQKNDYRSLLFRGPSGCGKSTIINLAIDENVFDIYNISPNSFQNVAQLKINLKIFCTFESVICFFKKQKKIIVIEDVDSLISTDRCFSSFLLEILKNKHSDLSYKINCPIVCVTATNFNKKNTEIISLFSDVITLPKLNFKQCFFMVDNIANKMIECGYQVNYEKMTSLIKVNHCDLRVICNHLFETFEETTNLEKINCIEEHYEKNLDYDTLMTQKKDNFLNSDIYSLSKYLMEKKLHKDHVQAFVCNDTNMITSLLHENYHLNLNKTKIDFCEIDFVNNMNEHMLSSEVLGKSTFDSSDSSLWYEYTYTKVKGLNMIMYEHMLKTNTKLVEPKQNINYSKIVNKQSLALNFNKKLLKMELNLHVFRNNLSLTLMYIFYICLYKDKDIIQKTLTKNEIEILSRFFSDFCPDKKKLLGKIKSITMH
jgi:DNA polymerase III delta prime subunit